MAAAGTRRLRRSSALLIDFPQCAYGTPYQKVTRLASTTPALKGLACRCTCGEHAEVLQGLARRPGDQWRWKTSLAAAYPARLGRRYAALLCDVAPPGAWRTKQEPTLDTKWERELATAIKLPFNKYLLAPVRLPQALPASLARG